MGLITYVCQRYLLLALKSSYVSLGHGDLIHWPLGDVVVIIKVNKKIYYNITDSMTIISAGYTSNYEITKNTPNLTPTSRVAPSMDCLLWLFWSKMISVIKRLTTPGPRFNIKMTSYQYRNSHCGDKTILRPSYLHNGISYTGKMTSLYWIRAQIPKDTIITPVKS